jgi:hypothetical protein
MVVRPAVAVIDDHWMDGGFQRLLPRLDDRE